MWAHYADSHRGFVVGLETDHDSLKNRADGVPRRCQRVLYTRDRPKQETLTDLTAEEAFFTKSLDWAYEREWRMLDSVFHADKELGGAAEPVFLFDFHPDAVREVILGARMNRDSSAEVLAALRDPDYTHVQLRRADLHPDEYRVVLRDVNLD